MTITVLDPQPDLTRTRLALARALTAYILPRLPDDFEFTTASVNAATLEALSLIDQMLQRKAAARAEGEE